MLTALAIASTQGLLLLSPTTRCAPPAMYGPTVQPSHDAGMHVSMVASTAQDAKIAWLRTEGEAIVARRDELRRLLLTPEAPPSEDFIAPPAAPPTAPPAAPRAMVTSLRPTYPPP